MIRKYFTIFLFFFWGTASFAEADSVQSSPFTVIYNHLYFLQTDSYEQEKAARSFQLDLNDGKRAAVRLKQILDGQGIFIDLNELPQESAFVDSISGRAIYRLSPKFPEIYVEKTADGWYYSKETVKAIPALHNRTFPFGAQWNTYFHAPFWHIKYLGLKLLQWCELVVLVVVCLLFFWLFNRLVRYVLPKFVHRRSMSGGELPIRRLSRVTALFVAFKLFKWLLPVIMLPPRLNSLSLTGLDIIALFFSILIALQILEVVYSFLRKKAEATESKMDDQLIPVLRRVSQIIVWTVGGIFILRSLDINVTALLAGISIGGLAIALAAQDTVKNFFGSILIFIDKPFQIGDWIRFQEVDGMVEEVGLRATRIRTFANSITYVPNGLLANQVVDNMGLRKFRRFSTELTITYDTSPDMIQLFVEGVREIIRNHPTTRKDVFEVHLNSFGSSSLNVLLYMFFEVPTWSDELKGRHEIMTAILMLARDLGIRFAFPTQTLHIEEFPGTMATTPTSLKPETARIQLQNSLAQIRSKWQISDQEVESGN
ncbi:MAG: mechanosensitive ion channel family protein [Flavobacteriales bacterium]|nr:mechanosensitive ion channel family protein [Flavobacteriales bacterium]